MLYHDACPRCGGSVEWMDEVSLISLSCVQCGFEKVSLRGLKGGVDAPVIEDCKGVLMTAIPDTTYRTGAGSVIGRCPICYRCVACWIDRRVKPHTFPNNTGQTHLKLNKAELGEVPVY